MLKNKLKKLLDLPLLAIVYAQQTAPLPEGAKITLNSTKGPSDTTTKFGPFSSLDSLVNFVINLVFGVGLAIALLFVIIGGTKYVMSKGDEGKATEARNTITNAIIGAVVIIVFKILLNLALNILGGGKITDYLTGN